MSVQPWWMWLVIAGLACATVGLAAILIWLLYLISHTDGF